MDICTVAERIKNDDKLAVLKTDTLYGLIGSAFSKTAVDKIYKIKKRNNTKPLIVLVANYNQLNLFNIPKLYINKSKQYWPGPYSLIMPVNNHNLSYLSNSGKIAFRLPDNSRLQTFIKISGPIVAPSANPEGLTPAKNISEAKNYFGVDVDYYIDDGTCENSIPSKLIDLTTNQILR